VRVAQATTIRSMGQHGTAIEVSESRSIATLNEFVILAECSCGHEREIHTLFLRRQLGAGVTVGQVRQKLRCHKCQGRMPQIKIYPLTG